MSARFQTWLWILQRKSAGVLALCVLVHLATMIVAIRGGLSKTQDRAVVDPRMTRKDAVGFTRL